MTRTKSYTSFFRKPANALEAIEKAQWIAFAPVVFKVSLALRNLGVLRALLEAPKNTLSFEALLEATKISRYGLRVLVDSGAQIGLVEGTDDAITITDTGYFIARDEMTTVNIDYFNDVCYRGLDNLEEAIITGTAAGLREIGPWNTLYEGLAHFPPHVQKSWLAFDHYYSDSAFEEALQLVFQQPKKKLLDIGGNTGKFAAQCLAYNSEVEITIVDLPGQIAMAKRNLATRAHYDRLFFAPADMLDEKSQLPLAHDAIWMSQFLDCFSEVEIVSILRKCKQALQPGAKVFILEPLTDRQKAAANAFCVELTSPYFTAMANGNSRMYRATEMQRLIETAGLKVEAISDVLGNCQTLITCGL